MTQAIRDQNRIPVWFGVSSVDGVTPTLVKVDSATGQVLLEIGISPSASISAGTQKALRDMNYVTTHGGQSNTNSTVFIPFSVNPLTGAILAQTT